MPDRASPRGRHLHASDLQAASRLAVDATLALTRLVEHMHHDIVQTPGLGEPSPDRTTTGITGLVYRSIRGVTHLVGGTLDALLGRASALLGPGNAVASDERDTVLAVINGVLGDHLDATANPLAITMHLHHDGRPLAIEADQLRQALPHAHGRVVLLIHGLCMHPRQWRRHGHDHGAMLAADQGYLALCAALQHRVAHLDERAPPR